MSEADSTANVGTSTAADDRIDEICDQFEAPWKAGERPSVEEYLVRGDASDRGGLLRELVILDLFWRKRAGERPEPREYVERFPDKNDVASVVDAFVHDARARPRFMKQGLHAQGGLGAVYKAYDEELHRVVALKMIRSERAHDPESQARFLREAEITGQLEHPGVVAVYSRNRGEDGQPYYAMRLIRGETLKDAVAHFHASELSGRGSSQRSLALRELLRRFIDVCNAVAYAHSRGVLHRDLKPENVMLGPFGETLVLDWGLAKPLGSCGEGEASDPPIQPSLASDSSDTQPGTRVGTPRYMSPEQAEGDLDRLGPHSDVYSLGATLYCLLTGRPPYIGDDAASILRAVQRGEFRPPRAIDPTIDPALEAVCQKAMALKPEDRYGSPRALVDDVERWMADERVSAYREPWTRTATRWLARHRTGVTGAAAAGLALLVGLGAVTGVQAQGRAALAEKNRELSAANGKIETRYELATEAIKTLHTGVSEDFLLNLQEFKALRNRLLNSALDFYSKLGSLLGPEADAASRRALLQANFEAADLTAKVGRQEDALAGHRSVLAARESLASEPGADARVRVEVGRSMLAVAGLLEATGQTAEALAEYRRAESLLDGLASGAPDARAALAACRSGMASLLSSTGENALALEAYQLARSEQESLAAAPEASKEARRDLAVTIRRIGTLLSQTGKSADAEAAYGNALAIQRKLANENPTVSDFHSLLADSHNDLGILLKNVGRPPDAEAEYRKALAIRQKLVDDNPAVTEFRSRLALSHSNLGVLLSDTGRPSEAEAEHREALAIRKKLADDNPAVYQFRNDVASTHHNLGVLLSDTGQSTAAETEYRLALAVLQKLAHDNPAVTELRSNVARSHDCLGILLWNTGRPADAEAEHRKALVIQQALADDNPAVTRFRNELASTHHNFGNLLADAGRPREAEAEYRKALAIYQKLADDNPAVTEFCNRLATSHKDLGLLLWKTGKLAKAETEYREALAIQQRVVDDNPAVTEFRNRLANNQNNLGALLSQTGKRAEAEAQYRQALAIQQKLADDNPPVTGFRSRLANSHNNLGNLLLNTGASAEAEAEYLQALAIYQKLASDNPTISEYRRGINVPLVNIGELLTDTGRASEAIDYFVRSRDNLEALINENPSMAANRDVLAFSLSGLGRGRGRAGERHAAVADLRRAIALREGLAAIDLDARYDQARNHGLLAGLAEQDGSGLASAEGRAHSEQATDMLKRIMAEGYRNPKMSTEPDFEHIRHRADFQLLMMDNAFPADPFARPR
jgi:eukaryotic-like serine/threonine-protein kinase